VNLKFNFRSASRVDELRGRRGESADLTHKLTHKYSAAWNGERRHQTAKQNDNGHSRATTAHIHSTSLVIFSFLSVVVIMHTVWVRLNAVVFFGLTVLLGLSCMAAISKIGHSRWHQPLIHKLELRTLRSLKSHGGVDRALLSFDINADMTPAFHWNIKQIFVYVVASYETPSKKINKVVLWDRIIEAVDDSKIIKEDNVFVKYALVDQGVGLRGKDVELSLMWDHMPITGLLYSGQQQTETTSFALPSDYQ
jgi:signal peptidase complex subunit 3